MQIGKQTLDLLKNFSTINPSIIIREGNELSTMSNNKDVVAYAKVDETFDKEVGIYDLNEFIATLNLFDNPDVELGENQLTISDNGSRCSYGYADTDIIVSPTKKISFPGADVSFELTKEVFDRIMKASSTLGLQNVLLTKDKKGDVVLTAVDTKNTNSNAFSVAVGKDAREGVQFKFIFPAGNLKMARGDYTVSISRKMIAKFASGDIEYFVALDKSSTCEFPSAE